VSGKQNLAFQGQVDTSAALGKVGTLLLDPTNITITDAAVIDPPAASDGVWSFADDPGNQEISPAAISTILDSTNLELQATDSITIASNVAVSSPNDFTLTAGNTITNQNSATITQAGGGAVTLQTGSIDAEGIFSVNPAGEITFIGGSIATSQPLNGDSGSIDLLSGDITLDGANISTRVSAPLNGIAGDINIEASNSFLAANTTIDTSHDSGIAGNITIQALGDSATPQLQVLNSLINSDSNSGDGDFSQVTLLAPNSSIQLEQAEISAINRVAAGLAADIFLNARDQLFINQSQISTNGSFGRIFFGYSDDSESSQSPLPQSILIDNSTITATNDIIDGDDVAGDIYMRASSNITLQNNSQISVETVGAEPGGDIQIETEIFNLESGTRVSASTTSTGEGGFVDIEANFLNMSGGAQILANTTSTGEGGFVDIEANFLNMSGGAQILANTTGSGDAGYIDIAPRDGNDLRINFSDGAQISTETSGTGAGGDLTITAPTSITISGSGKISADTVANAVGTSADSVGGSLTINTQDFTLADNAIISADTRGSGNAGTLLVNVTGDIEISQGAQVSSSVANGASGNGGLINLSAQNITLGEGGQVVANTAGSGIGGTINVEVSGSVTVNGNESGFFATTRDYIVGVTVTEIGDTGQLADGTAQDTTNLGIGQVLTQITGTLSDGNDVDVYRITLAGDQTFSATSDVSTAFDSQLFLFDGGGLGVYADDDSAGSLQAALPAGNALTPANAGTYYLAITRYNNDPSSASGTIFDSGVYLAEANGPGASLPLASWSGSANLEGGSYTINLTGITGAPEPQAGGTGGSINIEANSVLLDNGNISATTAGQGVAGNVTLTVNTLTMTGETEASARILTSTSGAGPAGNITIDATQSVSLSDRSSLRARSTGSGNAGNITVRTPQLSLNNGEITVSSEGSGAAGSLNIAAAQIELSNQSRLEASTATGTQGGNVSVVATNSVSLSGNSAIAAAATAGGNAGGLSIQTTQLNLNNSTASVSSTETGTAGSLSVQAQSVNLQNASTIEATTQAGFGGFIEFFGLNDLQLDNSTINASTASGESGYVFVDASNLVSLSNNSAINVEATNGGSAGYIEIQTNQFNLNNSRASVSSTGTGGAGFSFNPERAGSLSVRAQSVNLQNRSTIEAETQAGFGGYIEFVGLNDLQLDNSTINASTASGFSGYVFVDASNLVSLSNNSAIAVGATDGGSAGYLEIRTAQLGLDNSTASVSSTGTGDAGYILIDARSVILQNRSTIEATTEANTQTGLVGSVEFVGLNDLQLDNSTITASTQSGIAGDVTIGAANEVRLENDSEISVAARNGGTAGTLDITTQRFRVEDSQVSVSSRTGIAGNLNVSAGTIYLYQGQLTAFNGQGSGGNINLNADGLAIQLRAESLISAEAFGSANGSNITVQVPNGYIIAFPYENSDITADADAGSGGTVRVDALALFGIEFRPARTPLSDITANSQTGADGSVEVNTLGIDPTRGLVPLAADLSDPTNQVSQACSAQQQTDNRFVVTGRGGLPASPEDSLAGLQPQVELLTPVPGGTSQPASPQSNQKTQAETQIVEAQGWKRNADGSIALVAQTAEPVSKGQWQPGMECQSSTTKETAQTLP